MKLKHFFAAGLVVGLSATTAFAETTLRYSNWLPATHPFTAQVIKPWIEDVAKATEGRVTIDTLPKVVGTVPTQFEVVRDGLADVGLIVDGYSGGRFRLNSIIDLPFLGNDARAISIAYWRIYKTYLEPFGEYENAIPAAKISVGPMVLATGSTMVDSVATLDGMKLRVASKPLSDIAYALGSAPVNKPVSELYELISTGVVDGTITSREAITSFKLQDAFDHVLVVPGGLSSTGVSIIISQEALAEMSDEDRAAFWSVSGEVLSTKVAAVYQSLNENAMKTLADGGTTITQASDTMMAELAAKLQSVEQDWIEQAKELGLENAQEVLAEFREEIAKVEAELAAN
jgi:TRAP-type C4-dicarboxylate transport system substrate-binding protein